MTYAITSGAHLKFWEANEQCDRLMYVMYVCNVTNVCNVCNVMYVCNVKYVCHTYYSVDDCDFLQSSHT